MRLVRAVVCAVIPAIVGSGVLPAGAMAQDRVVTLEEALRLADKVQPQVVSARVAIANAALQRRSAVGAYLPTVSAGASTSESFNEGPPRIDPATGQLTNGNSTSRSIGTSLDASLDLFTGFRRGAEHRAARASERSAQAGLTDAQFQQALATTNAFFDALAAHQTVAVRETGVVRADEQLKLTAAKLSTGSATRADSLRVVVEAGNARLQLLQAQTTLAGAEATLARIIGMDGRVRPADDSAFYRWEPIDADTLRQLAEATSPRVQSAAAQVEASRAAVRAARSAYWPSLRLSAGTSWGGNRSNGYDLLNNRQLNLSFNWQLFNGFNREQNVGRQVNQLEVDEARAADTRREVAAQLIQRVAELNAAKTRIEITQTGRKAAAESFRIQQERYRIGSATIIELTTAQDAVNQAEIDEVTARFDYLRAKAQVEALIGRKL